MPLDQVHVMRFDIFDVPLPVVQALPRLDDIPVVGGQVVHPVEDERRRDPLTGAGAGTTGALQLVREFGSHKHHNRKTGVMLCQRSHTVCWMNR